MKTDHYLRFKGTPHGLQIIADVLFTIQHPGAFMTVSTGCRLLLKWEEITTSTVITTHKHDGPSISRYIPDECFTERATTYMEPMDEPSSRPKHHYQAHAYADYFAKQMMEQMYNDMLSHGFNFRHK